MTDIATTKPGNKYASIRNPRVYEALRREGYSKESAARISNAQAGRGRRKRRAKSIDDLAAYVDSPTYDPIVADVYARALPDVIALKDGELLAPGIRHIRGNLCNVHGRYGRCPGAPAAVPRQAKPAKGKRGRRAAKPKKTPEQRAAERQANQQANRDAVKKAMADADQGLSPSGFDALIGLAGGKEPNAGLADGLTQMGMAERGSDGVLRLTATGRAAVHAANRGDAKAAIDAVSRGTDLVRGRTQRAGERTARQTQRERERAQKKREVEQRRAARQAAARKRQEAAQRKRGGDGKKPAKEPDDRQAERAQRATETGARVGLAESDVNDLRSAAEQGGATNGKLQQLGLIGSDGFTTDQGRRAIRALELGNVREYQAALQDARARMQREQRQQQQKPGREAPVSSGSSAQIIYPKRRRRKAMETTKAGDPGDYLVVEDRNKPTTWHLQVKKGGTPDHRLMGAAWAALHGGYRGNKYQGPNKQEAIGKLRALYKREGMDVPSEKAASFRVFKDTSGHWRWVAISTTAYLDRDGEIVSTKALEEDVARADATGMYGPLRWWHAPTLDLGDCDFNAMDGRVLIESGTFKSEAIAQKIARHADGLELSIGFLHPPTEPDADGVFHHIRRFERSVVPRGKASNLYTNFQVKGKDMLTPEKHAALKERDFSDEDIAAIEAQATATQKAADDAGVRYKDAPEWALALITRLDAMEARLNGEQAAEKEAPAVIEEQAAGDMPMGDGMDMMDGGDGGDGGLTLSPEDLSALGQVITQALQDALAPLVSAMDITNKIGSHMDELKSMFGGYQTKKDSETAETKQQIEQLQTSIKAAQDKLAELLGEQPRVAVRPSEDAATTVKEGDPLLPVTNTAHGQDFADLIAHFITPHAGNGMPIER